MWLQQTQMNKVISQFDNYKNNRGALVQCAKHLQWSTMGKKKW